MPSTETVECDACETTVTLRDDGTCSECGTPVTADAKAAARGDTATTADQPQRPPMTAARARKQIIGVYKQAAMDGVSLEDLERKHEDVGRKLEAFFEAWQDEARQAAPRVE